MFGAVLAAIGMALVFLGARSAVAALPRSSTSGGPTIDTPLPGDPRTRAATLTMPANFGDVDARPPPIGVYRRFETDIERFVAMINAASSGLQVGLNYWWRPVGEGSTKPGSQHYAGLAVDVQGVDQADFATRCRQAGLVVVDRDTNDGSLYNHVHVQYERAGYLARLGISDTELEALA